MGDMPLHRTMQDDQIDRLKAQLKEYEEKGRVLMDISRDLKARVTELENYEALKRMHRLDNYPNELSAKAWLLRKQAEAVDWAWHKYCRESASEDCKVLYQGDMEDAVKALRQQVAALERQSEGGE